MVRTALDTKKNLKETSSRFFKRYLKVVMVLGLGVIFFLAKSKGTLTVICCSVPVVGEKSFKFKFSCRV